MASVSNNLYFEKLIKKIDQNWLKSNQDNNTYHSIINMKPVNQTHIFSKGSSKDIYNKDPEF